MGQHMTRYRKNDTYTESLDKLVYQRHVVEGVELRIVAGRLGVSIGVVKAAFDRERARRGGETEYKR